jgi:hypothetical protein
LLFAIVEAGPLGPSPKLFAYGVGIFIVGLIIVRKKGKANP